MKPFVRSVFIVAILTTVAVGCSKKNENMANPDPASMDELFERYFGKSLEQHKNRKIYTELNAEIIATIPDEDLEQAIRDFTAIKIDHDWENDVDRVPALGPGFSAVYFLSIMDAEVNNGGFNQFFYNCGREAVLRARDGADLLNLKELSAVVSKALQIEEEERDKMRKVKEAGTIEAFFESYDYISFKAADDAFMKLNLDLPQAMVSFIRWRGELFEGRATD
jgi:hypothetical protein